METVPEYSTRVWTCRGWRVPYSSSYRMIPSEQGFDLHGLGREGSLYTATGTSVRESDESNTAGQLGGGAASLSGADGVVRGIPILLQIRGERQKVRNKQRQQQRVLPYGRRCAFDAGGVLAAPSTIPSTAVVTTVVRIQ